MAIRAGELSQRIVLLARAIGRDQIGEDVGEWSPLYSRWARAIEGQGREYLKAGQVSQQRLVVFQIRWAAEVNVRCRVMWQGRIYEIVDVTGTYQSGEMWLHCQSLPEGE